MDESILSLRAVDPVEDTEDLLRREFTPDNVIAHLLVYVFYSNASPPFFKSFFFFCFIYQLYCLRILLTLIVFHNAK